VHNVIKKEVPVNGSSHPRLANYAATVAAQNYIEKEDSHID